MPEYALCSAPRESNIMCEEQIKVIDLMERFTNKIMFK